jgi:cysteine-rich repeat protein
MTVERAEQSIKSGASTMGRSYNITGSARTVRLVCVLASVVVSGCGNTIAPSADAAPEARKITIERSHAGGGKVTSTVDGIDCGATCTASVADGTTMVLTATPDDKSVFAGWSGPCNGTDVTCSFTIHGDVTVGAGFDVKHYTVTVVLEGGSPNTDVGTVSGAPGGLNCSVRSGACSASIDVGAQLTLTAVATASWRFVRWSVASCSGTAPCALTVNADQTVTATFAPITCGNSIKEAGEECDDGNTNDHDDCTNACKIARCGDAIQKTSGTNTEECDDGNSSNTDACTNACKVARCGDQFVWNGHEECDDGNANDQDDCTNACKVARCGDGIRKTSGTNTEECDDGNSSNTDACTNACKNAVCGDQFVWSGHEECDDGNSSNTDACTSTCKNAKCGDGFVWSGHEECDDGPTGDNFCTSSCHCGGLGEPCCATGPKCDAGTGCASNNRCSACPVLDFKTETCQSGWPGTRTCMDTFASVSDIITGSISVVIAGFNGEVSHSATQSGARQISFSATVHEGDATSPGKNTTTYNVFWCRL